MRLVNDANAESPFYVGNCKANTPPKHVTAAEGTTKKEVTINGEKATLIQSQKSPDYVYIQLGDKWLWVKDATMFSGSQTSFVNVPAAEKPKKAPKQKAEKPAKAKKEDAADIGLDVNAKYNVYGTEMTGAEAKKRFGLKNVKDGLASGKITLLGGEGEAEGEAAPAAEGDAETAAA